MLTEAQKARYSRNMLIPELGEQGQEKLLGAKVLVVGVGGLGSPVALYLAAAGVGTIGLVDSDVVDTSNLQRQVIYSESDLGKAKVSAAHNRIQALNSDVTVQEHHLFFDEESGAKLVADYDFIIDATDSITTKFLINDICVAEKKPFCHGGVLEFVGQAMTVVPGETACYRCFFKKPPEGESAKACSFGGILGSTAGLLGSIQASEALKFITGAGDNLLDTLLICDVSSNMFRTIPVAKRSDCSACGEDRI